MENSPLSARTPAIFVSVSAIYGTSLGNTFLHLARDSALGGGHVVDDDNLDHDVEHIFYQGIVVDSRADKKKTMLERQKCCDILNCELPLETTQFFYHFLKEIMLM